MYLVEMLKELFVHVYGLLLVVWLDFWKNVEQLITIKMYVTFVLRKNPKINSLFVCFPIFVFSSTFRY